MCNYISIINLGAAKSIHAFIFFKIHKLLKWLINQKVKDIYISQSNYSQTLKWLQTKSDL